MSARIKLCGLSTPEAVSAAIALAADFIGLVIYPPSPRNVTMETAAALSARARGHASIVTVLVDPDDGLLDQIARTVAPDYLQLHGEETSQRIATIKSRYGIPVIKALRIAQPADLGAINAFDNADFLMLDAKTPGASLPGGTGHAFDWCMLQGKALPPRPWFLSGGLNAENVAEALHITGAPMVDVSSGIESAPGVKDIQRMKYFVTAVRSHGL
jgi:phosphoribosylanthranilate isomerase